MNQDWMRKELESYQALCVTRDELNRSAGYGYDNNVRELDSQIRSHMAKVREILKRLDPTLAERVVDPDSFGGNSGAVAAVQEGLGILRDHDEWMANLAPDSPSLSADEFHPHIWNAASALWDTGKYRVAVEQAAVSLSAHIAVKAGSSLSERRLVAQVFSPNDPDAGQMRLHMPGDKSSNTWKSRQEGLHLVAQGAFAGIRNVAAHTDDEWSEHVALEHLAVLSLVARWADETAVVHGKAPRQP